MKLLYERKKLKKLLNVSESFGTKQKDLEEMLNIYKASESDVNWIKAFRKYGFLSSSRDQRVKSI